MADIDKPYDVDDDEYDDEGIAITCPQCEGPSTFLGQLGVAVWYRCRQCGADFMITKERHDA